MAEATPSDAGRAGAYAHFQVEGVGWGFYDRVYKLLQTGEGRLPGVLAHLAGATAYGWDVIDLWERAELLDEVFTPEFVEAISRTMLETGIRPDVEPDVETIARTVIGPASERFTGVGRSADEGYFARIGLDPVATITRAESCDEATYARGCARIGFPASIPDGMVMHIAGPDKRRGWKVIDVFTTRAKRDSAYERMSDVVTTRGGDGNGVESYEVALRRLIVEPELIGGGHPSA